MAPVAVDPRRVAGDFEKQVGVEADQAVASARLAAFNRFEHPVAAAGLDKFERRRYRGFDVGNHPLPDDGPPPCGQRFERGGPAFQRHRGYSPTGDAPVGE